MDLASRLLRSRAEPAANQSEVSMNTDSADRRALICLRVTQFDTYEAAPTPGGPEWPAADP